MTKSKSPSVAAQKKADQLEAEMSALAFYKDHLCQPTPTASQTSDWTKLVSDDRHSMGARTQAAGHTAPRIIGSYSEGATEPISGYRKAPTSAATSTGTPEGSRDQSSVVANTNDEWTEVRHKKTRAKRVSEPLDSKAAE